MKLLSVEVNNAYSDVDLAPTYIKCHVHVIEIVFYQDVRDIFLKHEEDRLPLARCHFMSENLSLICFEL